YDDYIELRAHSEEEAYCRAIDELYRLCNQLEAEIIRPISATAPIQRSNIGKLIGSGGQTINAIRNETSASIWINNDKYTVTVETDTQEQLDAAVQKIQEVINTPLQFKPTPKAEPRVVGDQIDQSPAPVDESFITHSATTSIPANRIGKLIGRNGETIQGIA